MVNGKKMKSFNFLFFHLKEWLKHQKWHHLVQSQESIYESLVRIFYANLTDHKSFIETLVKSVKITLTTESFGQILGIPTEGAQLTFTNVWSKTLDGPTILSDLLDRQIFVIDFPFTLSLFNLEMLMLLLVITHIFLPRVRSHMFFSYFDDIMCYTLSIIIFWIYLS